MAASTTEVLLGQPSLQSQARPFHLSAPMHAIQQARLLTQRSSSSQVPDFLVNLSESLPHNYSALPGLSVAPLPKQ